MVLSTKFDKTTLKFLCKKNHDNFEKAEGRRTHLTKSWKTKTSTVTKSKNTMRVDKQTSVQSGKAHIFGDLVYLRSGFTH